MADNTSSRQIPLLAGLALQILSACLFIGHPSVYLLLVARAAQGASAAIVYSVGLALTVDTFGVNDVGEKSGYALSSATLGVITGPLLGGIVYRHTGYDAVVALMIALVALDILLRCFMIEKKIARRWQETTPPKPSSSILPRDQNAVYISNGTFGSPKSIPNGHTRAVRSMSKPEDENVKIASEQHSLLQKPVCSDRNQNLPPLYHLISSPRILADIGAVLITYILLASFDSDLALFVKQMFRWNAGGAGLIYLTIALPSLLSPVVGRLSDKFGARWIIAAGFAINFVCVTLLRLVTTNSLSQIVLLCVLMTIIGNYLTFYPVLTFSPQPRLCTCLHFESVDVDFSDLFLLIGFALSLSVSPAASDLTATVEKMGQDDPSLFGPGGAYAQAFALFNCAIAAGTVLGPLWTSFALKALGWGNMNLCLAIVALLGVILVVSAFLFDSKSYLVTEILIVIMLGYKSEKCRRLS